MHDSLESLHKTPGPELRVNGAGLCRAPKGKDFPPHQHSAWEVIYYLHGDIPSLIGAAVYRGRAGVVLAVPPFTVHSEQAVTAYANIWISVNAPVESPWPIECFDDAEGTFGALWRAILREFRGNAADREEMLALLVRQLDLLLRRSGQCAPLADAERVVREAEQLLASRFATPLTLLEVAREIGVSPSTLRAHFTRLRGRTPMNHLQELRVRHALTLIRTSTLTLETIASLSGYYSVSHLSRYVKRVTGRSPGALRAL